MSFNSSILLLVLSVFLKVIPYTTDSQRSLEILVDICRKNWRSKILPRSGDSERYPRGFLCEIWRFREISQGIPIGFTEIPRDDLKPDPSGAIHGHPARLKFFRGSVDLISHFFLMDP